MDQIQIAPSRRYRLEFMIWIKPIGQPWTKVVPLMDIFLVVYIQILILMHQN